MFAVAAEQGRSARLPLGKEEGGGQARWAFLLPRFSPPLFFSTPTPSPPSITNSDRVALTPLTGGGVLLSGWQTSQSSVVLAIAAPNDTATAAELAYRPVRDGLYTRWFGASPPEVDPLADDPLSAVLPAGTSLLAIVEAAAGPASPPMRITVTGFAYGGALARGVALWGAGAYPIANLRLVTFGAPRVGDARFDWASEQLVDLAYHWAADGDPTVEATLGGDPVEGGGPPSSPPPASGSSPTTRPPCWRAPRSGGVGRPGRPRPRRTGRLSTCWPCRRRSSPPCSRPSSRA